MRIAIIGTGISGLGSAYLLDPDHEITLYEKNDYVGGHSRTLEVQGIPVDTGFIVFNYRCYPNLTGLFAELNVPVQKSSMSFGVSIDEGWLEYGTESSFRNLFGQKRNLARPAFLRMLKDILTFNRVAAEILDQDSEITLGDYIQQLGLGEWFHKYYLFAMGAAIWSCPAQTMLKYPAKTFIRFFDNHGLLSVNEQPQWYTVSGGSKEYVKRLTQKFSDRIRTKCAAVAVTRKNEKVMVKDSAGNEQEYDRVIFASHPDETLSILTDPSAEESVLLSAFEYQPNSVILHGDKSFMPKRRATWSSWVYLSERNDAGENAVSLSYWMNNLQTLDPNCLLIETLNPSRRPQEDLIYDEHVFDHPIFDQGAIDAQAKIESIQGRNNTFFCGAWTRYGFHEDGILSAVNVAKHLEAKIPWE